MPDGQNPSADAAPRAKAKPREQWLPAVVFALCVLILIGASVYVLSFDRGFSRSDNPQTDNAYVGGDVTAISARVQGTLTALPVTDN